MKSLQALWPRWGGAVLVVGIVVLIEVSAHFGFKIPDLHVLLLLAVVYAAFSAGYRSGFISAFLAWLYIAWFFSLPEHPFQYQAENLVRIAIWGVTMPLLVWMAGKLQHRSGDLAQLRELNAELWEKEERLRVISALTSDYTYSHAVASDGSTSLEWVSEAFAKATGYTLEELNTPERWINIIHPDYREPVMQYFRKNIAGHNVPPIEFQILRKNGTPLWLRNYSRPLRDARGRVVHIVGAAQNITERRQVEEALRKNEKRFRALIEHSSDAIVLFDAEGKILYSSPSVTKVLGYLPGEHLHRSALEFIRSDWHKAFGEGLAESLRRPGVGIPVQSYVRRKDGEWRFLDGILTNLLHEPSIGAIVTNYRDITEQKHSEELVARLNKFYAALSKTNQMIVRVKSEEELFENITRIAIDFGGLVCAWIGLLSDETRMLLPVWVHGPGSSYVNNIQISVDPDVPEGKGPAGFALREGRHQVSNDFLNDQRVAPWHSAAKAAGIRASIALPLRREGRVIGLMSLYADQPDFFVEDIVRLLDELAANISFALDNFSRDKRRERAEEALRTSEAQLSNALKIARAGHWEYDVADDLFTFNDNFYAMLRTTAEQEGGYRMSSSQYAKKFVHPDDMSLVGEEIRKAVESADPGFSREIEHRIIYADGETGRVTVRFFVVKDDRGRTVRTYGVNQDITRRVQMEQSLQMMSFSVDHAGDGVFWVSPNGHLLYVNESACKRLGYSQRELLGMTIFDLDPDFQSEVWGAHWQELKQRGTLTFETRHRARDGRIYPVEVNANYVNVNEQEFNFAFARDITERKKAEEALRDGEQRMRLATEAAGVGIWEWNVETDVIRWDAQMFRIYGIAPTADGLVNYGIWSGAVLPEDLPKQDAVLRDTARRLGRSTREFRIRRQYDSAIRIIQAMEVVRPNEKGGAEWVVGTNRDITELKKAEEALRTSEQRLRGLIDGLGPETFVGLMTPDGILIEANQPALKAAGLQLTDVADKPFEQTYWWSYSETVQKQLREAIERAKRGEPSRYEVQVRVADGKFITIDFSLHPLQDETGKVVFLIPSATVITARKQAEEKLRWAEARFRQLINSSPDVIYATTLATRKCVYVSETLIRMTGHEPREMLDDPEFWRSHVHPEDLERLTPELDRKLDLGEGVVEYRFRKKNSEYIWVRDNFRAIRDDGGKPAEVVGSWTDITVSRRTEEQLAQSQKMEAIGQLTGGVAHDFNNRLTVIIGNLELLQRKLGKNPALENQLKSILSAAEGASDLTRQLLTFSRRQVLEPTVVDINELITNMHDLLQRTLGETIDVVTRTEPRLWQTRVDRTLMENVLLNLAVNARDAMPHGGMLTFKTENAVLGDEYVDAHRGAAPGDYVLLSVSDTGVGMSEEVKQRIFEPFFTTKPAGKGTGLGLAMVYGFVKQSGGYIEILSEPGRGSAFKIYLPRDVSAKEASPAGPERKAGDERMITRGKVVLLVEDDHAVRKLADLQLSEMGCEVLVAGNGPEAMKIFAGQQAIDLLFTDVIMPGGMTGMELAAKLRERLPGLRVLYTSGYAPQAAADRLFTERPNDFWLAKPYRSRALKDAIIQALSDGKETAEMRKPKPSKP